MTLDETMIINNMTNVIKNLEQSKRICDIIDDLNKLILTLGGNHDITDEPEQVKHVPEPVKAVTVTHVHTETKDKTVMKPAVGGVGSLSESPRAPAADPPRAPAAGPPSESKPVQKQTKAKTVTKAPAPGRGKV